MAIPRNYKAYLKKDVERIERNKFNNKYSNISCANREIEILKAEMKRKDRKKMLDISCQILSDEDIDI